MENAGRQITERHGYFSMKKKIVSLLAASVMSVLLAGCGSDADVPLHQLKVDKYVTLGDYDSFEITVDTVGVDEDELLMLMNESYLPYVTAEHGGITDRAVAVGDTVIIDYEGKKDGVAFEGGTAQNASLAIGSGQFIDGFEDGLVGVMPGDTVDLDLSFPEVYQNNPDLAGQPVVFTVTVHCIQPESVSPEEMEDEVVSSMGVDGVNTVEDLRQAAYDYLADAYESEVQNAIMEQLTERCVFKEIPDALYEPYRKIWSDFISMYANYYGVSEDTYTTYFYGASSETVINENAEAYLKQDFILQAIANREDLNVSDEEVQEKLAADAAEAGYASVEEYMGTNTLEDFRNDYMNTKVMEFLKERATVSAE